MDGRRYRVVRRAGRDLGDRRQWRVERIRSRGRQGSASSGIVEVERYPTSQATKTRTSGARRA
jgi:hypothetical protein